jgi:hypothetical protein
MPRSESFDAQFDRVKRQLQDAILTDYPNPERKGCPGDAVLKDLATGPFDEGLENNPRWHHLTHCSECYREFLEFRAKVRREAEAARIRKSALVAALLVLAFTGGFFGLREFQQTKRRQTAELTFRHRVVYLEGVTRSAENAGQTKPLVFAREPEELTIRLALASPEGAYEIQIEKTAGSPLLSATGQAKMENGTTTFTVKLDLSKLEPGDYFMCVRRVPLRSVCHPITIQ